MTKKFFPEKLVRRMASIHNLDDEDKAAIHELPVRIAELRAHQDIVREGDRPSRCCIVFEGMTCWYKTTGEGIRQILSFQIAGDIPDLHGLHLSIMDSSLLTISPCTVGFVNHELVREIAERRPGIASAFWRMTLIDAAIFREWVINVGGRRGYSRIAHLLCEQVARLRAVGLVGDDLSCEFPLSQAELGDAVGLSAVHVNRSLQALRKNGLITFDKSILKVLDWPRLQIAGDFDPTYLFLSAQVVAELR